MEGASRSVMKQEVTLQDDERSKQVKAAFGPFLREHLKRLCQQASEAEIETLEKAAVNKLASALKQEKSGRNYDTLLYRLAVSVTLEIVRQAKQKQADQAVAWVDLPDLSGAEPQQLSQQLQDALAHLSEQRRRAVALHFSGLSEAEIGDLLGWSDAKAHQQIERGLRDLRKALEKAGIEYETDKQ